MHRKGRILQILTPQTVHLYSLIFSLKALQQKDRYETFSSL